MSSQYSKEDSDLIEELARLSKKSPKLVRSTVFQAPAQPSVSVRSWKMNEYKYNNIPCPFPTLARGLFTEELEDQGDGIKHRIVVRGYDKFFNIGEVPWTRWSSIESHTASPYTLTLKSNGCIIFIAALTPEKLIVTSKHSVGARGEGESHAARGEWWLRKQFEKTGKTEEQLAKALWENNWTAAAELCDDEFEEHVLPYPPEKTGLHLHGINKCTKAFMTMPPDVVNSFAKEWGFIETAYTTLKTIQEVKEFTDKVAKSGSWNGESVEGFVVRTHVTEPPTEKANQPATVSPYPPGSSFFFKVKFDEPYMMYRDWREVTRTLLSKKNALRPGSVSKAKMKRPETRLYVRWVIEEIKKDPKQFEGFSAGHGIIATRERFLQWLKAEEGKTALQTETSQKPDEYGITGAERKDFSKTIIVPIAVPGCGKTAISVALVHLFGFGHTQSDDVQAKKPAPVFIKNVVDLLKKHDVVIADKNNHLKQHRQQLRDATKSFDTPVRLMALNWSLDQPLAAIHRICGDRVYARGENHQTLRADTLGKAHEDVIWQFLHNAEELDDEEVDVSVEMSFDDTPEQALSKAVDACVNVLGLPRPTPEKIEEALQVAKGYAPRMKKPKEKAKKAPPTPRYFALLPEFDLEQVLGRIFDSPGSDVPESAVKLYSTMRDKNRIAKRPHITIVHSNSLPTESELWERCMNIHRLPTAPLLDFKLGDLVWNDRVMAIAVENLQVVSEGDAQQQEGGELVSKLPYEVREHLHITVGTADRDIAPVEAKALVEKWREGEKDASIGSIPLQEARVQGTVKGLMN
ncbi:hypothetical protein OE88DRAFT_1702824 [Heliocybe sulcata]|uniref:tRNA ligase n=1 Tax=Heliocybe sulcata TaxID=5364 RepID=A0A5C3MWN0_9AGAM|nr:hypothetical protein OE88DRAFT_1702824 [Heliocybe sulcata]